MSSKVPGFSRALALVLVPNDAAFLADAFPVSHPVADIGSTPPNFQRVLSTYSHLDILRMIVHYNEDFDIAIDDPIQVRIEKFRAFLITQLLAWSIHFLCNQTLVTIV